MANTPQKAKDATEEALNAIQEALSIRPAETRPSPSFGPVEASLTDTPPPHEPGDLFPHDGTQAGWQPGDAAPRRAANDDRIGVGQILQALRHRPARGPYIAAGGAGFIWAILCIAALYSIDTQAVFGSAKLGFAAMLAIAGAPDLPQALQQALRQAVARPWTVALPFGTPAAWPWMPMPVDPWALWALSARPMQAWLDLWRAWAEAWLPEPATPPQE